MFKKIGSVSHGSVMPSVASSTQIESSINVVSFQEQSDGINTDEDGFRSTDVEEAPDDNFHQIVSQFINIRKTFH